MFVQVTYMTDIKASRKRCQESFDETDEPHNYAEAGIRYKSQEA